VDLSCKSWRKAEFFKVVQMLKLVAASGQHPFVTKLGGVTI
jgi:hypothetical protein